MNSANSESLSHFLDIRHHVCARVCEYAHASAHEHRGHTQGLKDALGAAANLSLSAGSSQAHSSSTAVGVVVVGTGEQQVKANPAHCSQEAFSYASPQPPPSLLVEQTSQLTESHSGRPAFSHWAGKALFFFFLHPSLDCPLSLCLESCL